jgi:hypothetical protein
MLTKSFIHANKHKYGSYDAVQQEWLRVVFTAINRTTRRHSTFTMDHIWAEIDKAVEKGTLPKAQIDHRILGPMLRHMAKNGLVDTTGYFTKATRTGGGSRPVAIWRTLGAAENLNTVAIAA